MKGATKTSYKIVLGRLHEAAVSLVMLTNAAIYRLLFSIPDLEAHFMLLHHHKNSLICLYRQSFSHLICHIANSV